MIRKSRGGNTIAIHSSFSLEGRSAVWEVTDILERRPDRAVKKEEI